MSYYRDNRTTITPDQVKIKGVPFPIISNLIIERSSIKSIELQRQGILERLVANGPTARDTWSCYDPLSCIRRQAVVFNLQEPLLGFSRLSVTFSDSKAALQVLRDSYADLLMS